MVNTELKITIGKRIATALKKAGVSKKYLAECLGKPHCIVSYWCSGSRTPNAEDLVNISNELNVSSDYLLGLTDYTGKDAVINQIVSHPIIVDNLRALNNSILWLKEMIMSNAFAIDDSCEGSLRLALQYAFPDLFDGGDGEDDDNDGVETDEKTDEEYLETEEEFFERYFAENQPMILDEEGIFNA